VGLVLPTRVVDELNAFPLAQNIPLVVITEEVVEILPVVIMLPELASMVKLPTVRPFFATKFLVATVHFPYRLVCYLSRITQAMGGTIIPYVLHTRLQY